jgi:hypothetical protein
MAWVEFKAFDGSSFAIDSMQIYLVIERTESAHPPGGTLISFVIPGSADVRALMTTEDYPSVLRRMRGMSK